MWSAGTWRPSFGSIQFDFKVAGGRTLEIRQIEKLVADNADFLREAWNEYFGN
jgi:hypothetical protein